MSINKWMSHAKGRIHTADRITIGPKVRRIALGEGGKKIRPTILMKIEDLTKEKRRNNRWDDRLPVLATGHVDHNGGQRLNERGNQQA